MDWEHEIAINADVQAGKLVIRGTRVPVEVLVMAVAAGDDMVQVASAYRVTEAQVERLSHTRRTSLRRSVPLRFLVDENVTAEITAVLARAGYDVLDIAASSAHRTLSIPLLPVLRAPAYRSRRAEAEVPVARPCSSEPAMPCGCSERR
jgi:uncharacterized protein (DUF433 family)